MTGGTSELKKLPQGSADWGKGRRRGFHRESGACVELLLHPEVHAPVGGVLLLPLPRGYAADAARGGTGGRGCPVALPPAPILCGVVRMSLGLAEPLMGTCPSPFSVATACHTDPARGGGGFCHCRLVQIYSPMLPAAPSSYTSQSRPQVEERHLLNLVFTFQLFKPRCPTARAWSVL